MTCVEKLINIENKRKKYNLLIILDVIVSMGLTLIGTVSIVSLLMYLYEIYNISFWECLVLDLILPSIYSFAVNPLIKPIDKVIKNTLVELGRMEEEYNRELEQSKKEIFVENMECRFRSLSLDNRRKLLNYVKDSCLLQNDYNDIIRQLDIRDKDNNKNKFDNTSILLHDIGYSRKRIKNDTSKE